MSQVMVLIYLLFWPIEASASSPSAIGVIDNTTELEGGELGVNGWACVYSKSQSISVHLYAGGAAGSGGTYLTEILANLNREPAVANACGVNTNFRNFGFTLKISPSQRALYLGKKIFVHGISNLFGGGNETISGSGNFPITISVPTFSPKAIGVIVNTIELAGGFLGVQGYACVYSKATSLSVHIYAGEAAGKGGIYLTEEIANLNSTPEVASFCGVATNTPHFDFTLKISPAQRILHAGKKIFIHGISNLFGGGNETISGSGNFYITSLSATPTPNPTPTAIGIQKNAVLVPNGFDPGMKKRLAADIFPERPATYFESCPDAPSGKCYGVIPNGGGFYTIPGNVADANRIPAERQACKINSGELFNPDFTTGNTDVPCPFYFTWKKSASNEVVAQLLVNTLPYRSPATINNYHGLQTNIPGGGIYAGLDFNNQQMTPYANDIFLAKLKLRSKVCFGDKIQDGHQFGRLVYYANFHSILMQQNFTLAFNIGIFHQSSSVPRVLISYLARESDIGGPQDEASQRTFHIDASHFGVGPINSIMAMDATSNCSLSIESLPWVELKIPIWESINYLVKRGLLSSALANSGKYSHGIIGGIETWGRSAVGLELQGHSLFSKRSGTIMPLPISGKIPVGNFRLAADGDVNIYHSDGNGNYCRYLTLGHADVMDITEVSPIYQSTPANLSSNHLCFNSNTFAAIAQDQQTGIYPAGKFRVRADGMIGIYQSNGVNFICQYRDIAHAGVESAQHITKIYDFLPQKMSFNQGQPFCN